jgi:hypothetical protein
MNCTSTNGRIDILGPTMDQFALYDKITLDNQCSTFYGAMTGNFTDSPLSNAFFSKENLQIIQNAIRAGVYKKSNKQYIIGPQNCDTLKIIMRSTFLQSSVNRPNDITGQISELNDLVIDYCVPQLLSDATGYVTYRKDVSTMYTPIDKPIPEFVKNPTLEPKFGF